MNGSVNVLNCVDDEMVFAGSDATTCAELETVPDGSCAELLIIPEGILVNPV